MFCLVFTVPMGILLRKPVRRNCTTVCFIRDKCVRATLRLVDLMTKRNNAVYRLWLEDWINSACMLSHYPNQPLASNVHLPKFPFNTNLRVSRWKLQLTWVSWLESVLARMHRGITAPYAEYSAIVILHASRSSHFLFYDFCLLRFNFILTSFVSPSSREFYVQLNIFLQHIYPLSS